MRCATKMFVSALLLGAGITGGLSGCSTSELKPALSQQTVDGTENAARTSVAGIRVLVQDATWPGDAPISQELTPLRVSIRNSGDDPLRVTYDQFTLVNPEGRSSSALPLYEIGGTIEEPHAVNRPYVVNSPGFLHTNFAVAPYLADVYPNVRSAAMPFHYDRYYYGSHFTVWQSTALPTPEMRMNALPEGVLDSGGQVDGWLYFRSLGDAERVVFRADLTNANSGTQIGELRVPFDVK